MPSLFYGLAMMLIASIIAFVAAGMRCGWIREENGDRCRGFNFELRGRDRFVSERTLCGVAFVMLFVGNLVACV